MLQNEYLIATIGVDTAENEPIGKSDVLDGVELVGCQAARKAGRFLWDGWVAGRPQHRPKLKKKTIFIPF